MTTEISVTDFLITSNDESKEIFEKNYSNTILSIKV